MGIYGARSLKRTQLFGNVCYGCISHGLIPWAARYQGFWVLSFQSAWSPCMAAYDIYVYICTGVHMTHSSMHVCVGTPKLPGPGYVASWRRRSWNPGWRMPGNGIPVEMWRESAMLRVGFVCCSGQIPFPLFLSSPALEISLEVWYPDHIEALIGNCTLAD